MSLVWKVKFPSQTQKLLMLRMADFAHEDGTGIYPAIETVATEIGVSRRQVQYAVKALEECSLVKRVEGGGKGNRKTNVWQIENDLLVELALQEKALKGVHDRLEVVENTSANIAPRDLLRVQLIASRVQPTSQKGEAHCTQTLKNHPLDPSNACASARDGSRSSHAGKARPRIILTPDDFQWDQWMSHFESLDRQDLRKAAFANGRIEVASKFPKDGLQDLISVGPQSFTDRMLGEEDAA
jgi:hypothetical protein